MIESLSLHNWHANCQAKFRQKFHALEKDLEGEAINNEIKTAVFQKNLDVKIKELGTFSSLTKRIQNSQEKWKDFQKDAHSLSDLLQQREIDHLAQENRLQKCAAESRSLEKELEEFSTTEKSLRSLLRGLNERVAKLRAAFTESSTEVFLLESQLQKMEAQANLLMEKFQALNESQDIQRQSIAKIREDIQGGEQRLKRVEELFSEHEKKQTEKGIFLICLTGAAILSVSALASSLPVLGISAGDAGAAWGIDYQLTLSASSGFGLIPFLNKKEKNRSEKEEEPIKRKPLPLLFMERTPVLPKSFISTVSTGLGTAVGIASPLGMLGQTMVASFANSISQHVLSRFRREEILYTNMTSKVRHPFSGCISTYSDENRLVKMNCPSLSLPDHPAHLKSYHQSNREYQKLAEEFEQDVQTLEREKAYGSQVGCVSRYQEELKEAVHSTVSNLFYSHPFLGFKSSALSSDGLEKEWKINISFLEVALSNALHPFLGKIPASVLSAMIKESLSQLSSNQPNQKEKINEYCH
jgi:hypothetical protein